MEFREVFKLDDRFEADLIAEALQEEEIPHQIVQNQETTLEPVFSLQKQWGTVLVPEDEADRAREVINEVLAARPVSDGDPAATPRGDG